MPDKTWYVLLVDNNTEELAQIQDQLEHHHIQVMAVDNGTDVLEALRSDPQPDAVILDLAMSESALDGGTLLDVFYDGQAGGSTPLFLLGERETRSATLSPKAREKAKLLRRPFDVTQFLIAAGDTSLKRMMLSQPSNGNGRQQVAELAAETPPAPEVAQTRLKSAAARHASSSQNAEVGWELRRYWHVLLRHKWTVMVTTVAAVAVALAISMMLTPVYEATAKIRVASAAGGQFDYGASTLATRLANTYVEIATSTPILDELAQRLGIEEAPDIEVEPVPETELLEISARHTNPQVAQDAANTLAEIMTERSLTLYAGDAPTARELLSEQVDQAKADLDKAVEDYTALLTELNGEESDLSSNQLEVLARQVTLRQQLYADLLLRYEDVRASEELRGNAITIIEMAPLPKNPASPKKAFNAILGAVAGLIGGLLLVIVLESFSNSIASSNEIKSLTGLPVIAQIPVAPWTRSRIPDVRRRPLLEDAFQSLQVRLQLSDLLVNTPHPVILVTSPEPGTGKTTVAVNLAISMARGGHRVILVDGDLHRPTVHKALNMEQRLGLSDILTGSEMPEAVLKPTAETNLRVVTSGTTDKDTTFTGLISVYKIRLVFRTLAEKCDYLIVDAPGLLATGYSVALAKQSDAIVLVTAQHFTDRDSLELSLQQLWETRSNVAGVVINKAVSSQPYSYRYSRR